MGVVDESIKPEYQSEDKPDPDVVDNVKIVVGTTFKEVTSDPTKDVLLEVYAPWCGHCKNLEPIYKRLAERFKGITSVVIAKIDGTANEHPDLNADGFPSLMFFPAEKDAEGMVRLDPCGPLHIKLLRSHPLSTGSKRLFDV
jgi:protein disulfide-isomerase A1